MPFPRGENYQPQEYEIRQMWPNGPSRIWSQTKGSMADLRYEPDGFVGSYVCQGCNQPVAGVYRSGTSKTGENWLCGGCAKREKPDDLP